MLRKTVFAAIAAGLTIAATPVAAQDTALSPAIETAESTNAAVAQLPLQVNFDVTQDTENVLFLDLSTGERVAIRLVPEWAPNHVERIKTLTRQGFYNGVIFHRVLDGIMAQTGDPTGTGRGGSNLPDLEAEFNFLPHVRGSVSMARTEEEDSANSQFFVVFYPQFSLDRRYTNFGRVISNMPAVDGIQRGEPPANPTRILQASIAADGLPQVTAPAPVTAPVDDEPVTLDMLNAPNAQ